MSKNYKGKVVGLMGLGLLTIAEPASAVNPEQPNSHVGDFGGEHQPSSGPIVVEEKVTRYIPGRPDEHWGGVYESKNNGFAQVRKLRIKEKDGALQVQMWASLKRKGNEQPSSESPLSAKATLCRDENSKGLNDTLIASFETDARKPVLVLRTGTPFLQGRFQKYPYLTYTCFITQGTTGYYLRGRLDRCEVDSSRKLKGIPDAPVSGR